MNRTQIIDFINNNLPNNFTKDITPEDLNVVLKVLNNNSFNITSEERNAFNTIYDDGNLVNWNVLPTEVQSALEELVGRIKVIETQNRDANTAYVNLILGNDLTANVGNKKKPFKTLQAALSLVVGSYAKIVYVGSTVKRSQITPTPLQEILSITGRDNVYFDFGGTFQDKLRLSFSNCSHITINLKGCYWENAEPFYNLSFDNCTNVTILGGTLYNTLFPSLHVQNCSKVTMKNTIILAAINNFGCNIENVDCYNCFFKHNGTSTTNTAIITGLNSSFYGCQFNTNTLAIDQGGIFKVYNSKVTGTIMIYNAKCNFENCVIESADVNFSLQQNSSIYLTNCQLKSQIENVQLDTLTGSYQSIIKNCIFDSAISPFKEPFGGVNTINGARVYSINNVYNKAFTPITAGEQRVFEHNKVVLTDLILPNTGTFV